MKTTQDIQTAINEKGAAYKASDSVSERAQLAGEIDGLQKQLSDALSKGANACPDGKDHYVMGMLKTPSYWDEQRGMQMPEIYEVGCVVCPPVLVEHEDGKEVNGKKVKRWSHSARGLSPKEAVDNWNSGKWVEDRQVDRVPSQVIFDR